MNAVNKAKLKNNTYYLNKALFFKTVEKSFDYAILEKAKEINAIKLDIPWSDLGNWKEISKIYKNINQNILKKRMFITDLGVDTLIYLKEKIF